MKIILDIEEFGLMPKALNLAFMNMRDYPNQEIGSKGRILYELEADVPVYVVRNQESYTVVDADKVQKGGNKVEEGG